MKKQSGFATVELVIVVLVLAAIVGAGYYVLHSKKASPAAAVSSQASYVAPVTTPTAPQITSAASLKADMNAINATSVSSNMTDSNSLSSQAQGF